VSKDRAFLVLKSDPDAILKGPFEIIVKSGEKNARPSAAMPASDKNIQKHFYNLPQNLFYALLTLSDDALKKKRSEVNKEVKRSISGSRAEAAIIDKLAIYIHDGLINLYNFSDDDIPLYYTTRHTATGNVMRAPCQFSDQCFINEFQVGTNESGISEMHTYMQIGDEEVHNLHEFEFNQFIFICKDHVCYILSTEDRYALNVAYGSKAEALADNAADFHQYIVSEIQKSHSISLLDTPEIDTIDTTVVCAVMLSELSDQYLIITPQFIYDGLVLEQSTEAVSTATWLGATYHIKRDIDAEEEFIKWIKQQHPSFEKKSTDYTISFADAKQKHWFLHFYRNLVAKDCDILGMDLMKHFRFNENLVTTKLKTVSTIETSVQLHCTVSFGKEKVALKELQKQVFAGAKTILLSNSTLGVLTDEWYQQYGTIIKHARLIDDDNISIAQWILLQADTSLNKLVAQALPSAAKWQQKWQAWQKDADAVYNLPNTVQANLREYQQKGYEWMALLSEIGAGALLGDDMGLGKTLQTISYLAWLKEKHTKQCALIICPASLTYNWQKEIEKFAPSLSVTLFSELDKGLPDYVAEPTDVLIVSYRMLQLRIDEFSAYNWLTAVLDESHYIKNPDAKVTRAVQMLSHVPYRVGISGTAVINSSLDLFSQLSFLVPDLLGSQAFFKKQYHVPIKNNNSEVHIEQLQRLTAPFVLRRTKDQVAKDLPEKTVAIRYTEMSEDQQAFYDRVKKSIKKNLFLQIKEEGIGKARLNVIQGIQKLRQICSSPAQVQLDGETCTDSTKIRECVEELTHKTGEHKVLIFSQYLATLDGFETELTSHGIKYLRIDGSLNAKEKADVAAEFEANPEVRVFLLSIKAASHGLTLVSADLVYLVEPWWNESVENQAIDRSHRIGQLKPVLAYKMICKNSIEEKLLDIQTYKTQLSTNLVQAEEQFTKSLSLEEVKYLFD
jgi:superfamily II DNA or RNA helicase